MSVLVITGGGRGIGAATALAAARDGWDLVLAFRRDGKAARAVAAECEALGVKTMATECDVAMEVDVLDLFEAAAAFGPVRGLVNNAGVVGGIRTVAELDSETLEDVIGVNVFGTILCAREAVRLMLDGGEGGAIVNVSSRAAVLGSANRYVDYAASKAAVDTFTVGLAGEVAANGIRVNAVRPGIIDTGIHHDDPAARTGAIPLGRLGTAQEVAESIVWLLSPKASYTTGTILDVGGGL